MIHRILPTLIMCLLAMTPAHTKADEPHAPVPIPDDQQILEKVKALMEIPSALDRHEALREMAPELAAWAKKDPQKAAELVQKSVKDDPPAEILAIIGREWVIQDHEKASSWASNLPEETGWVVMPDVAVEWAKTDPAKAARYAKTIGGGSHYMESALADVAIEWAKSDPSKAIALVGEMNWPHSRSKARGGIATQWAKVDPEKAAIWAVAIKEDPDLNNWTGQKDGRDLAISNVTEVWAKTEPVMSLALTRKINDPDKRSDAEGKVYVIWAASHPAEAAQKAHSIADAKRHDHVLRRVIRQWAKTDPVSAIDYSQHIIDEKERENTIRTVYYVLADVAEDKPAQAAELASRIDTSDQHYLRSLSRISSHWAAKDPDPAINWARTLDRPNRRIYALAGTAKALTKPKDERAIELAVDAVALAESLENKTEQLEAMSMLYYVVRQLDKPTAKKLQKQIRALKKEVQ